MATTKTKNALASYAHAAWSGWMKYMFSKCTEMPDGSVVIPKASVQRWERQMSTDYADLPEPEKKSDLAEADKILAIVNSIPLELTIR